MAASTAGIIRGQNRFRAAQDAATARSGRRHRRPAVFSVRDHGELDTQTEAAETLVPPPKRQSPKSGPWLRLPAPCSHRRSQTFHNSRRLQSGCQQRGVDAADFSPSPSGRILFGTPSTVLPMRRKVTGSATTFPAGVEPRRMSAAMPSLRVSTRAPRMGSLPGPPVVPPPAPPVRGESGAHSSSSV